MVIVSTRFARNNKYLVLVFEIPRETLSVRQFEDATATARIIININQHTRSPALDGRIVVTRGNWNKERRLRYTAALAGNPRQFPTFGETVAERLEVRVSEGHWSRLFDR